MADESQHKPTKLDHLIDAVIEAEERRSDATFLHLDHDIKVERTQELEKARAALDEYIKTHPIECKQENLTLKLRRRDNPDLMKAIERDAQQKDPEKYQRYLDACNEPHGDWFRNR
jgi:hypothetical protein